MTAPTIVFDKPLGAFRDSIRAYREHKKKWQAEMEVKLMEMEEEIKKAKADPFYKVQNCIDN
jgi:hypothetical protein